MLEDVIFNEEQFMEYVSEKHPIDIAEEFSELDREEMLYVYHHVDAEFFANIVVNLDESLIREVAALLDVHKFTHLLLYLNSDDVVDILGFLSFAERKEILNLMKTKEKAIYKMLLGYDSDSAGGIMTTDYIALKSYLTAEEALKKVKSIGPNTEYIDTIYIVDQSTKLIGYLSLRELLLAKNEEKLENIMSENTITIKVSEDQEVASDLVSKYDLTALPVVSENNRILGIITVDDIIDVLIEEQSEDILRLGGVSDQKNEESISASIRARLPWLCINLFTAFLAALVVSMFDNVIDEVVALAVAMPIVAGMGGNAGTQALSVMIRNISLNDVSLSSEWKKAYQEILTGLVNGLVTGLGAGLVIAYLYNNIYLGILLLVAMTGNLILAGLVGSFVPLILKKLNFDPALASSIFITTATDICGFFLFLSLGSYFIDFLS